VSRLTPAKRGYTHTRAQVAPTVPAGRGTQETAMKNEATRRTLEIADRNVHQQLKGVGPLFIAVEEAAKAYRAAGCETAATAYERINKALLMLEDTAVSADMVAVMTHKYLAGVGVPATAQDETPVWMQGHPVELD